MQIARAVAASALGASVVLGGVSLTSPAQAASPSIRCQTTTKTFQLPHKPAVRVSLNICARYNYTDRHSYRHYRAWLHKASWDSNGWRNSSKRFNKFSIGVRLEHGNIQKTNCRNDVCFDKSIASDINDHASGYRTYASDSYGSVDVATKKTSWTGGATADVDIAGDGLGSRAWDLHRTSAVH